MSIFKKIFKKEEKEKKDESLVAKLNKGEIQPKDVFEHVLDSFMKNTVTIISCEKALEDSNQKRYESLNDMKEEIAAYEGKEDRGEKKVFLDMIAMYSDTDLESMVVKLQKMACFEMATAFLNYMDCGRAFESDYLHMTKDHFVGVALKVTTRAIAEKNTRILGSMMKAQKTWVEATSVEEFVPPTEEEFSMCYDLFIQAAELLEEEARKTGPGKFEDMFDENDIAMLKDSEGNYVPIMGDPYVAKKEMQAFLEKNQWTDFF